MYNIGDEYSQKLIDEHNLKKTVILFDDKQEQHRQQGLEKLKAHTSDMLRKLNDNDDLGGLVYIEAHRFLCDVIEFQTRYECYQHSYYNAILDVFHELGFLTHKPEIKQYKQFKKKRVLFYLKITFYDETKTYRYMSSKNMAVDWGRYTVDRLLEIHPRQATLTIDVIENLMNS